MPVSYTHLDVYKRQAYHSGMGLVDSLVADSEYSDDGVTLHTFPYAQMRNYVYKINRSYAVYHRLYEE